MNVIQRQIYTPQYPRQVSTSTVRRSKALEVFLKLTSPSAQFSTAQLFAVVCNALNESVLLFFLRQGPSKALQVIKTILEDHGRDAGHTPKDLQLNIVANLICCFVRDAGVANAGRYELAEKYIRHCDFDPEFKLQVRKALFDRQAVQCNNIMLHPYQA